MFMVFAASAVDFEYEYEGQTLKYTVIKDTEDEHTVKTKEGVSGGDYGSSSSSNPGNTVSGDLKIPTEVDYNGVKYTVTSIGIYAFYCCKDLTSVEIPKSVTEIGMMAFFNCSGLTSV